MVCMDGTTQRGDAPRIVGIIGEIILLKQEHVLKLLGVTKIDKIGNWYKNVCIALTFT